VCILDDYHLIDNEPIDSALAFLVENLPAHIHLMILTREDPKIPLSRLRARNQLTELRGLDLRFTHDEASEFLRRVMGLHLSPNHITTLEQHTEGWIAGLQLAALSVQSAPSRPAQEDILSANHPFVWDYLLEEVLQGQPDTIQHFLMHTAVLDRFCGALCDALLQQPLGNGQAMLEMLDQRNLFIIPLDHERRWYRYHHLFGDLLRQRLQKIQPHAQTRSLHNRASQWYEDNGFDLEAFHQAVVAQDNERAERLADGKSIPLHFRGAVMAILDWLGSLSSKVLDARPSLWLKYASLLLVNGQTTAVEAKLQATERALLAHNGSVPSAYIGQIATTRAVLALAQYDTERMLSQSQLALAHLPPQFVSRRATAYCTLGYAHMKYGDYGLARQYLIESIALSASIGDIFINILANISFGLLQELENQLHSAYETYQRVINVAGNHPVQIVNEAYLGLARIEYEWNHLATAEELAQKSLELARQYESVIDRFIISETFIARLKMVRGDLNSASVLLAQAHQTVRQHGFTNRIPDLVSEQIIVLLRQGKLSDANHLAQTHGLKLSQVRVYLAHGNTQDALTLIDKLRPQLQHLPKEWLALMLQEALAWHQHGAKNHAFGVLDEALTLAEPQGFVRLWVDEGLPMANLLSDFAQTGNHAVYVHHLLEAITTSLSHSVQPSDSLLEPLSQRELDVLRLVAYGLSNQAIGEKLFIALDTVKGHNRRIFEKLQVQRRTEAVARARELGLV
jgi:LuxR family transcriptional regulator, maltose regulon positive regulatory protein